MRILTAFVALGLFALPTASFASGQDLDNNGIVDDETWVTSSYDGPLTIANSLVAFPVASDNFTVTHFPYWWSVGDTGWGTRTISEPSVSQMMLLIQLDTNVLSCDTDEFDVSLNGVVVGHFSLGAADGLGPIVRNIGPFPPVPAMPGNSYELRYTVTETVAGGCGSVSFDLSGNCGVQLSGPTVAVEPSTWGHVKALYQ